MKKGSRLGSMKKSTKSSLTNISFGFGTVLSSPDSYDDGQHQQPFKRSFGADVRLCYHGNFS